MSQFAISLQTDHPDNVLQLTQSCNTSFPNFLSPPSPHFSPLFVYFYLISSIFFQVNTSYILFFLFKLFSHPHHHLIFISTFTFLLCSLHEENVKKFRLRQQEIKKHEKNVLAKKNVPKERMVPIPVSEYVYWSLDPLDAWDPNSLVKNILWYRNVPYAKKFFTFSFYLIVHFILIYFSTHLRISMKLYYA